MSIKSRSIVFATFFSNCLIIGLLVASLTTDYWIHALAKKHNAPSSVGRVHFGLLSGTKSLNSGVGFRNETIDGEFLHEVYIIIIIVKYYIYIPKYINYFSVVSFVRDEPETINFMLWLGAAIGTAFGLFSSAVAAIASVLKSASDKPKRSVVVLLMISNFAAAVSQMLAFICWLVQFYQYLSHNIFPKENLEQRWHSTGNAWLGHSFFFVVVGCIIACINVILIISVINLERRERRVEPPCDEKAQGAIMLY